MLWQKLTSYSEELNTLARNNTCNINICTFKSASILSGHHKKKTNPENLNYEITKIWKICKTYDSSAMQKTLELKSL